MTLKHILCLDDFEKAAAAHLPRPVFGYIAGAAETNASLRANRSSFEDYCFTPRVMVDVSKRSLQRALFGHTYSAPFGISPLGISALSAYRGDLVLTQAAQKANIPMIMSGSSLIRLEEVAKANPRAWFQAYLPSTMGEIEALVERVRVAGFGTLVITVDTPVTANRENNLKSGFSTPLRPSLRLAWDGLTHPTWLFGTFLRTLIQHGMPHFENNYATRGAPILSSSVMRDFADRGHLSWDYFSNIRKMWPGTLVVKGVLHPGDASIACDLGADGIIVSNHGGRQLDGAIAPLRALPKILRACPGIPVMMDSGIRRGGDVLKALALGAHFVFLGRPFGFSAAVAGAAGVHHAIGLLSAEVSRNMAMLGVTQLDELCADHLATPQAYSNVISSAP
jgi:L-lactate dehydrogenase (cytochrome)